MSDAVVAAPHDAANSFVRGIVLTLTLVLSCALGLVTPYLLAVIGVLIFAVMLVRGTLIEAYRTDRAAQLFLFVFVALGICFAITAQSPGDVVFTLNFIMLVLYAPFAALFRGATGPNRVIRVADLALAGTVVAFMSALIGTFVFNWSRAESPIFGAILLANTAYLLGFLSLLGVIARGERSWLYTLGPVLGIVVIALTGSRGPLLAVIPLTFVAAWFIGRELKLRPLIVLAGLVGYLAVSALIIFAVPSRSATVVGAIGQVLEDPLRAGPDGGILPGVETSAAGDTSTNIRMALYVAGYEAFLERPTFGYGWARLMSSAQPHLPPGYERYAIALPQLHNDIVNFAVAAGVAGIALYILLLLTPLVAVAVQPRDSQWMVRLFGVLVLTIAYACDGLTDLMFGFEFHSAFFVVITAILGAYCRDPVPSPR
jgi:O-antigen ligase